MPRSALDTLILRVTDYFRKHAAKYGLNPDTVEARYILNMGGFVNASFFIKDGQKTYHLKLADDEDAQENLERWASLHQRLSDRYHAPLMLDWIKIPRMPFQGPLFTYIPGKPADLEHQPNVFKGVLDLLPALQADHDLADALTEIEGEVPTCTDYFLSVYIERFDGDLIGIVNDLPPFVPLPLYDWMMSETRELEGLARDLPAFQHPANYPTHGDLWESNILVTETGEWFIVDWDDLSLGDPALEYSIVLGPLWRKGVLPLEAAEALLPDDPAFRQRFELCLRAMLLDKVIDTLADWVESNFAPDHQARVRAEKEQEHREALKLYQTLY